MSNAPQHHLPNAFIRTTTEVFGERGVAWLATLPALLDDCQRRWSLTVQPPFDLSYNYVAPALRADGVEVVLKAGVPNAELVNEMNALRVYAGRGSVRLLECDAERGVMMLERLRPGVPLIDLGDDEQMTRLAAQMMCQLWQPAPGQHSFPTVRAWAKGLHRLRHYFNGGAGPLSPRLVETAERLFDELLDSMADPVLLHGDLHHWNILSSERDPWLALDPKGIVGEPAYEVGALLRNPSPQPTAVQARRVAILAEVLGIDRARIVGWGLAQAVLSAWWSIEDHGHGWEEAMACAESLEELL